MKRKAFVLCASIAFLAVTLVGPATSASAGATENGLTVMTRNLYLGADVGEALKLLPDTSAAAQFLWTQVEATAFDKRVTALAAEVDAVKPSMIGVQEGTTWVCTPDSNTQPATIFDFTKSFVDATAAIGTPYVVAEAGGQQAMSSGFSIGPLVGLTVVNDPARFQPLFGTDAASCGFRTADLLLVRADLASSITAVGTDSYPTATAVFPGLITVNRGYAWADISISSKSVRVVTTQLESYWTPDSMPPGVSQAHELADALQSVTGPLIVMGDFNSDPRDPRPVNQTNPGGQPVASAACPDRTCNAYWTMVDAGFTDAGPDISDPANFTWGADAMLAGPSLSRLPAAIAMGNSVGFTDRLDYVFTRGDIRVLGTSLVGDQWPDGPGVWACSNPDQVANTAAAAAQLGIPVPDGGRCFATDHAGIVASLGVGNPPSVITSTSSSVMWLWLVVAAGSVLIVGAFGVAIVRKRR